jgi:hypothetical protein
MENLTGTGRPDPVRVGEICSWDQKWVGAGAVYQTVVACNHLAPGGHCARLAGARYRIRFGPDGAGLELLDVLCHENVLARFARLVIGSGDGINSYSHAELVARIQWIESDTLLRTEDELLAEAIRQLGFKKRGSRIVAALTVAIRQGQPGMSRARRLPHDQARPPWAAVLGGNVRNFGQPVMAVTRIFLTRALVSASASAMKQSHLVRSRSPKTHRSTPVAWIPRAAAMSLASRAGSGIADTSSLVKAWTASPPPRKRTPREAGNPSDLWISCFPARRLSAARGSALHCRLRRPCSSRFHSSLA